MTKRFDKLIERLEKEFGNIEFKWTDKEQDRAFHSKSPTMFVNDKETRYQKYDLQEQFDDFLFIKTPLGERMMGVSCADLDPYKEIVELIKQSTMTQEELEEYYKARFPDFNMTPEERQKYYKLKNDMEKRRTINYD